jgi:CubicO group peptidase (beta-lactamase class C family)
MATKVDAVRLLVLAGACLASCAKPSPQTASVRAPGCERLNARIDAATPQARQIDELLERYAQYGFSGTVLVRQGGVPVLHRGYGWAVAAKRIENSPTTVFDVASLAKVFTAAAILDLEARGRLSTGDPLSRFLPGLPADKQAITLHHLLTHTSGYALDASDAGVTADDSREEMLAHAASAKLLHPPGARYEYSNLGYGLLAHVVERASGKSWQAYVRERLVKRASLKNTFLFGEDLPDRAQLAIGYMGAAEEDATAQPPMTAAGPNPLLWGKHPLGAVGVFASVGDLDRWWCVLNGPRLLPATQRGRLFTIQAANQSYGWNVAERGGLVTRIHRGGLRGSYQSLIAYYPERRDLLVYGINKNVGSSLWAGLVWGRVERVLRRETVVLPPALGPADEGAVARLAAEYRVPSGGRLIFRKKGSVLFFGAEGQDALDPLEYGERPIPPTRQGLHEASLELVRALSLGNTGGAGKIGRLDAGTGSKLIEQWNEWQARIGGLRSGELLGSTPGTANYLRVFLRLRGASDTLVVRLLWDSEKNSLLAWGDDIPLPSFVRLWPQGQADFVDYDLTSGRTRYFRFRGDEVTVSSTGEDILLRGTRIQ